MLRMGAFQYFSLKPGAVLMGLSHVRYGTVCIRVLVGRARMHSRPALLVTAALTDTGGMQDVPQIDLYKYSLLQSFQPFLVLILALTDNWGLQCL